MLNSMSYHVEYFVKNIELDQKDKMSHAVYSISNKLELSARYLLRIGAYHSLFSEPPESGHTLFEFYLQITNCSNNLKDLLS